MAKNSKVFDLIKEMSMSEKRHFKIFADKHVIGEQNNYITLFNVLDKEEEEDEDKIEKKLKRKKYPLKYISADKNYLYQLILKSLIHFHSGRNTRIKIKELLIQTDILHQKGLFAQASKLVVKAEKLAQELGDPHFILECNDWKRKVDGPLLGREEAYTSIDEARQINKKTTEEIDYLDLYYQMSMIRERVNRSRDEKIIDEIEDIVNNELLKDDSRPKSMFATVKFHQVWAQYYFIRSNHEKEYHHCNQIVELIDRSDAYKKNYPFDYLAHKSRQLAVAKFVDKPRFLKLLKAFRSLSSPTYTASKARYNFLVDYYASMSELAFYIYESEYKLGMDRIENIRKELNSHERFLSKSASITFHYLFAYLFLASGHPKQALKENNTILNEYKLSDRPDLFHFSRLLNLIIHFELENVSLIPYLHKSTENFFKKNNSLYPFENLIMDFFKNVTEDKDLSKLKEDMTQLKAKMDSLRSQSTNTAASYYFNIEKWLQSKINGTSMTEVEKD